MTLGCKVNQYETGAIEELLIKRGHELAAPGDGCDVCIFNTCTVTAESARKSRRGIRRLKKLEPGALVAVYGCFSQAEPEIAEKLGADLISGTFNRHGFAYKIEETVLKNKDNICQNDTKIEFKRKTNQKALKETNNYNFEELPPGGSKNRTRALLKIQDGCDNYCTYCIVPQVRGRSRSLSLHVISQYAKQIADQGYKEIVITGIEISSYGKDQNQAQPAQNTKKNPYSAPLQNLPDTSCEIVLFPLIKAIQTIHAAAPNVRLRLGSIDPSIMTEGFIKELKNIPNLCNHFHLSLQSGCDKTLKRMGRSYTASQVKKTIETINKHFTDCGITADLITGFPGETENEFHQTLEFIKNAGFSNMHIFPFSPRTGTKAAEMQDQIDITVRKQRAKIASGISSITSNNFKLSQIGKIVTVLFEQEKNGYSTGHSSNYLEINVKKKIDRNTIENVRITDVRNGMVSGEII